MRPFDHDGSLLPGKLSGAIVTVISDDNDLEKLPRIVQPKSAAHRCGDARFLVVSRDHHLEPKPGVRARGPVGFCGQGGKRNQKKIGEKREAQEIRQDDRPEDQVLCVHQNRLTQNLETPSTRPRLKVSSGMIAWLDG